MPHQDIIARKGEIFSCPSGHELYRARRDISGSDYVGPEDFEPIGNAPRPRFQTLTFTCHVCSRRWMKLNEDWFVVVCVGGVWRSARRG